MVEVIVTREFKAWYRGITDTVIDQAIDRAILWLERFGVALGHPQSSQVLGSRYAMRELRVSAKGQAIRIFYIFDPRRRAVLLVGAIKTGGARRFYREHIALAEQSYETYLKEIDDGDEEED